MSEDHPLLPLVKAYADLLKLPVEESWWPGVISNFELGMAMAALVDEFPLADEAEPAAVYEV
jgi:hypothetical protein